jgi:hypothetical protein
VSLLIDIAETGMSAAGAAFVVRAVLADWLPRWLLLKPFSCDLCMSWWGSLAFAGVHGGADWPSLWPVPGAVALSLLVLKTHARLADVSAAPIDGWATLPEHPHSGDTAPEAKE